MGQWAIPRKSRSNQPCSQEVTPTLYPLVQQVSECRRFVRVLEGQRVLTRQNNLVIYLIDIIVII